MTIKNLNRLISVWRGNETPPTNYHIWIKEDSTIWYYKDKWTILTASDDKYEEIMSLLNDLRKSLGNYYTKSESDDRFITVETDPTVPLWAKLPTKPKYTAQEVGALPDTTKIPSKTSDLKNDNGFITISDVPTKVSAFKNDAGYITKAAIPVNVSAFKNDAKYVTEKDIPTKLSQFSNDVGYLTKVDIPTKTSLLTNDSGFVTVDDFPTKVSEFENDKEYVTKEEIKELMGGVDSFYSKEEIDSKFVTKIEFYNKVDEIDSEFSSVYAEIDNKADLDSPVFTGTPSVPTPGEDADQTQVTNILWVKDFVGVLVANSNNVVTDVENNVGTVYIGKGEFSFVGGEGISIQATDEFHQFSITNTNKLGDHSSYYTTYGVATDEKYGHVKMQDQFLVIDGVVTYPEEEDGVAASPHLVYLALNIALNAAKQELDFANLNILADGVDIATYDPQSDGDVTFNFVGKNGISISQEGSDIVVSAPDILTLDSIHEGKNVYIRPYNAEGGITINATQREVEAFEIDETGNTTETQTKIIEKTDENTIRFGKGLMSKEQEIDISWAEVNNNNLIFKI